MTTVATARTTKAPINPPADKAATGTGVAKSTSEAGTTVTTSSSARAGAAVVVDLSAAARLKLTGPAAGTLLSATSGVAGIKSFDEIVQDRTKALADRISAAFKDQGIPLDEPINLKLDGIGTVTTDSHYKTKIEKLFKDDPDLAKEFKEVAGLNAMKAAQKALEAFENEKKAARDGDERDAAYGRYTGRLMQSQELSGTMTLDDGKLRSWSVEFMDASVGETKVAKASTQAEALAAQRVDRTA